MPFSGNPWGWDDEQQFEDEGWGWGEPETMSIWKPHDPDPWFSPTLDERNAYRAEMARMSTQLATENLGAYAEAFAPSGFGADYAPPGLGWTKWGSYQPKSRVGLSSWGWNYGLDDPFPVLSGAIISPTIDIFTRAREQEYDESGRPLHDPTQRVSTRLTSGRATVGSIMRTAGERGQAELARLMEAGMKVNEAGPLAERVARQSVRAQVQPFGRADFGERWSWPYGLREAIAGSAQIRFHGDYSLGPKALFGELARLDGGYFTKATSPSVEQEHPERGSWQAYSLNTLYALGWLPTADGGFITGSNKPAKRRQLGVQRLAAPVGADHLLRTGRLTGDTMLSTTAVFLDNYPFSEGSGVADPTLVKGFRDYRPLTIERPMRAGEEWKVRFEKAGFLGLGRPEMGAPGESVFVGEQFVGGKWEPLEMLGGKEGVSQRIFGHRKTKTGYQVLVEREFPFESGTGKLMHHGMKALLFQSSQIIQQMQGKVRSAMAAGLLPGDVEDPRLVLPMPKDWMQTYRGMFDFLPEETLRGMGVSAAAIKSRDWQAVAPEVIDRLHAFAEQRRFTFEQQHEVPVERLGAWTNVQNASAISYFEKGGQQWARFTATHTGYALPIAAGIRMEYPGKKPMYSPEELMQVGRLFPGVAKGLLQRGNAASRIWGVAAAAAEGIMPKGAISHEMLPWVSARLGIDGSFDEEGTARTLVGNLARELRAEKLHRAPIVGPGGVLLPAPADVLGKSIKGLSGQEQSAFVSSYVQAMKLLGTGQDATEALASFAQNLQTFAAGHNVRREAVGARLERAAEGTFTSHMAIPDDVVVAGESTLRRLAGIGRKDPEAGSKLDLFIKEIEAGRDPFYVLGTRRPVSDMHNQLGVPLRVITERMAQELYDVPIENLGRSYAVSPTVAGIWRGDVDADRALLHAVTRVRYNDQVRRVLSQPENVVTGEVGAIPTRLRQAFGNTGYEQPALVKMRGLPTEEVWREAGASFVTPREVLRAASSESLMVRQINALRTHAPGAYDTYLAGITAEKQTALTAGLQGDKSAGSLLALSEALHGIDVDWNESKKWSDELKVSPGKNLPQTYAWYADPTKDRKDKTVFTRAEMLADFEATAKSKMLMGRGYNRFLRGLTSMARSPQELQAAITFASNVYQKALDNQPLRKGELTLLSMMESIGPSGAMFDKFGSETEFISSAFAGGPAGMFSLLSSAVMDVDAPPSVRALLFSRDPAMQKAVAGARSSYDIIRAVGKGVGQVPGAASFLEDPSRAGILPQLVQALHFSKGSMQALNLNAAEQAYAAQGQRIRSMVRVLSRGEKEGLPLGPYQKKGIQGQEVDMPGAIEDIRSMAGLDTRSQWQRAMAARMGLPELFFASEEDVVANLPSFANPALSGEEFPAFISEKEADVLEGLRQMPVGQAQQIAAAVSRPARYTPKGGAASFDTGPAGWDKYTPEQQAELKRMLRYGQPQDAILARMREFILQMEQAGAAGTGSAPGVRGTVPPAAGGDAFVAHQVFEEFGGTSAFRTAIDSIRLYKEHRLKGDPLIPGDRLTRRAVNEIIARGGGEPAMAEWAKIMGQFGVGFRHQMEDSPSGPKPVWSHSYGSLGGGRSGKVFTMPDLTEEQFGQFESMVGKALRGVMPDPETFLGALTEKFMTTVREKREFDVQSVPALLPIFQQLMGTGDELEIWQTMRGPENMQTRVKMRSQGLRGIGREYLTEALPGIFGAYRSSEAQRLLAEGYNVPGIGKEMVTAMRSFAGADIGAARAKRDPNVLWRGIEAAQKLRKALGEDFDPDTAGELEEALFAGLQEIEALSAEDRAFAQAGLASVNRRRDFDYERVWLRDPGLAKALRTFGQRAQDRDVARMSPEEQRKFYNQQRDAMASIRDRMGVLGIDDLGPEFDAIQEGMIERGGAVFGSRAAFARNARAYGMINTVLGGGQLRPETLARNLAEGHISAGHFRALDDLSGIDEQIGQVSSMPLTAQTQAQRLKLLEQRQGVLTTMLGMTGPGEAGKNLINAFAENVKATRELSGQMKASVDIEQKRYEQMRQAVEADPRFQQAQAELGRIAAVQAQPGSQVSLLPEQVERFKAVQKLRQGVGLDTDVVEGVLQGHGISSMLKQLEGEQPRQGLLNRLFRRGPGAPEVGAGAIENMFTELTLGWTAFRARMAWNLATGAQRGWMQDFMREETAAVGSALAGGVSPGPSGMASNYLSAQAALANARAQMGEGSAQVYAPFMAGISGLNLGPGVGAAATLAGTPLGVGFVSALGLNMLAKGLESAALGSLVAPVGLGLMATTGVALASSYVAGEAPEWYRYDDGSYSQRWRARARMSELAAADQPGVMRWGARMAGAIEGALGVDYATGFGDETEAMRQMAQEQAAYRPGTLVYDADRLRDWISTTYENRVPVDNALQLMGSLFQITGQKAQGVYAAPNLHVGPGADFRTLMNRYVQYMEGGASPNELFSSQVTALNAAGVPLGPQALSWMVQFANQVPGEQRQMYEQAFQNLSPLASATMRPTTFEQATQAVALAQSTGSMQRAASMVMGQQGVGWFTGAFGLEQEGAEAKSLGRMFTAMPVAQQETIQRYGGTLGSSMARMGLSSRESALFSMALGLGYPNDVTRVANLVVQAESVSLEAGKDGAGFRELVAQALGAGMEGRSAAEQRWFLAAQSGVAGIAPQAFLPASAQAQQFEAAFSLSGQDRIRYTQAAAILNEAYPEGYSQQQMVDVGAMLQRMTIPQALLSTRAGAGMLGIGASMGLGLGSAGAQLIDTLFTGGAGSIPGMSGKEVRALSGVLSPSMFQYLNAGQMAGVVPGIRAAFDSYYNDPAGLSLYQFSQAMEHATGSTPWGYSSQLGFGPGSLTDSLGRPYGQYTPWTATAGRQAGASFAPLFDLQMSASYANLGYASAANAAQSRQFERQLAMSRLNWGSGPFQPLEAVQAAMFPEGGSAAAEPGSGMQLGGSTIGFAQQESAIRRQMWQESLAQQRQSIEFSRQGLELARQGLEISRQELALSRQQYAAQREYKLGEQQAQRGMQLRQYEWSAEDYAIKVERTGITQAWAMEDLQRARRYATGRQRVEIERQIERTQVTQGWEQDDQGRGRDRELEVQRYQDQRYEAAVSFEQKLHALQIQRFDLQEQRLNLQSSQLALQEAQLAAQEARLNANAVLQEKLNQLEDERFKVQYEQAQAQMVDDEKLEKLRKAARDAELAYQAAQLANAETLRDAEQKFADGLKGIKEGGVLDKWIEFFNAVRAGPPAPPVTPTGEENSSGITVPGPTDPRSAQPVWHTQPAVNEVGIGRELTPFSAQPTIVNFVLDGEVIMSAVVKPERLRPVVQEIQRRDSWR